MSRKIEVVPYDPSWPTAFELEREKVALAFEPILESIHHIGSTSVPGLSAKPVIDILVVVDDDATVADYDGRMSELLYTPRGECLDAGGTPGRFYYSKTVKGVRTHHTPRYMARKHDWIRSTVPAALACYRASGDGHSG